jgi:5-(carboxyamino)imidazole ribonucleotide mutase
MSVAVIMGSASDWETMRHAVETLESFGVRFEKQVVSAHRTPELMFEFAQGAAGRGVRCIIAGAGGAAHLPGMVAALTPLPVLGVPVQSRMLSGVDSLLSIVQMPAGVPTATFAIGPAGATNAALFAIRMLALHDSKLQQKLAAHRADNAERAKASTRMLGATSQTPTATARKVRRGRGTPS